MTLKDFLLGWRIKYPIPNSLPSDLTPQLYAKAGTFYLPVKCPYCLKRGKGEDKSHHCNAHYEANWFKCHRCGAGGSVNFLLGIAEAPKSTEEWKSYTIDLSTPIQKSRPIHQGLEKSNHKPGATVRIQDLPFNHVSWQYLISEGFREHQILELADTYGIYYCTQGKQMTANPLNSTTGRLIFEIREDGVCYGWQARWLPRQWPASPLDLEIEAEVEKYLFSGGLRKTHILYNWDLAQEWDMWIVVEGIKKVWKTGKFGLAGFGIGANPEPPEGVSNEIYNQFWSVRLKNGNRPVGLLYDRKAFDVSVEHAEKLRKMGVDATALRHPPTGHDDLDKYHTPEIRQMIKNQMGRLPKRIII